MKKLILALSLALTAFATSIPARAADYCTQAMAMETANRIAADSETARACGPCLAVEAEPKTHGWGFQKVWAVKMKCATQGKDLPGMCRWSNHVYLILRGSCTLLQ